MPLTRAEVCWRDILPPETGMTLCRRLLFDLAEPVAELASMETRSSFQPAGHAAFAVKTVLKTEGLLSTKTMDELTLVSRFEHQRGLESLVVYRGSTIIVEIHHQETADE
jgi:hypothetical protein